MDHPGPMGSPADTARRDGLLAALLAAEPGQVVLRWDADVALLLSSVPPRQILLLTAPAGMPEDRLAYAFSAHVKTVTRGNPPTHFVVLGGGPEVASALKKVAPLVHAVAMGFHHVDAGGRYAHVAGQRLALVEDAVNRREADPIGDRARLGDALARGRALIAQERAVIARLQGRTQVTAVIIAVCAALTALSYVWGAGSSDATLLRMGANSGAALRHGEVWRLFASAFLHAGWTHLLMNMFALWSLGPMLEAILGPRRYLLLYGASALGGSLASGLLGADHWSVGASGAIWGLLGAAFGLALRPNGVLPPRTAQQMKGRAGVALVINLGITFAVPGIDFRAHLGGGAVGFALMTTVLSVGLIPLLERATPTDVERGPRPLLSGAAALTAAAMVMSIVVALLTGRPWETSPAPEVRRTAIAPR